MPFRLPAALERIRGSEVENGRLGVPAHVTILVPFLDSARLDESAIRTVERLVRDVRAFDVTFAAVRRWPPSDLGAGVVWLAPNPAEPFTALTRSIWAAFPQAPPYGRATDDIEPHLTIAIDDPSHFDRVMAAAPAHLPFTRRAASAILMVEGARGRWSTVRRFVFG